MTYTYLDILTTPGVIDAQAENGARDQWEGFSGNREFTTFDENATAFIQARDSFYMATNSESGWPYIQHRGGPIGFLKVLDHNRFGFADFSGNRQYISVGNAKSDGRVSLFLMDYARRKRMKILAHMKIHDAEDAELRPLIVDADYPGKVERLITFELEAYDWNCPQHITQRFTKPMVEQAMTELRAENDKLREQLEALS